MVLFIQLLLSFGFAGLTIFINLKNGLSKKYTIMSFIIILVACFSRLLLIEKYMVGLNQDEASIGYEAYSLLNYGVDRNGFSFPVHFVSWGSGQNALYAYILIPIIKLFGLSHFSIRLPMAFVGCLTILIFYFLSRDVFGEKQGLISLLIFSIMPWHIMKSRWGLESNLFPDLIFYSIVLIYYSVRGNKKYLLYLSSAILGMATYSYGTSYLFIPVFIFLVYLYLFFSKQVSFKQIIVNILIVFVISLPMIIFVLINYFDLNTVSIFNITIPKLDYNRFKEVANLNTNFIANLINNIKSSLMIVVTQNDGLILNCINKYGIYYYFSLPFFLIGIIKSIKNKEIFLKLNNMLFLASLILCSFVIPNINRINVLWIPMIVYISYGIICLFNYKKILILILSLYFISFVSFEYYYFNDYQKNDVYASSFYGLQDAIEYSEKFGYDRLYISSKINQPYIYYLLYTKMPPYNYLRLRSIPCKNVMFQQVEKIDKVYFEDVNLNEINKFEKNIYIMFYDSGFNFNIFSNNFETELFGNFIVIRKLD